jgi:hypothetical protein
VTDRARQDKADVRAGRAEERLEALEGETHDDVYAADRAGHGGHEDRIGELEKSGVEDRAGHSGHEHRLHLLERVSLQDLWRDTVPAIAVGLAFWAFTLAQGQVADIRATQERVEFENLRNCIRANVNAALVQLSVQAEDTDTPQESASNKRIARLYPILDCRQSQIQGRSMELSPIQTRTYIGLVTRGRAPIIRDGQVVGSRSSVLEGITSPDDVGKPPPPDR